MARTEAKESGTAEAITYVCEDCGRVHYRNSPPCNDCGSMSLSAKEVDDTDWQIDEGQSWDLVRAANREITGIKFFVYAVGIGTFLLGAFWTTTSDPLAGLPLLGAGVLATPAVRWRFERRLSVHLSAVVVLLLYLGLCFAGIALGTYL